MPIQLKIPQPGDLITVAYLQDLIAAIQNLDARVTSLESLVPGGAGQLAISNLQWALGDLHIGDELTIAGVNLGIQGETRVDFDGLATVTVFKPGSNDKKIILDVPAMPLDGPSKMMALTISNPRTGADSRNITVFQGLPTKPDGTISFAAPQFPAGIIQPAADLLITVPLAIQNLNMDTVFNISASAALISPTTVMTALTLDDVGNQITTIALPRTDQPTTRTIKVKVIIPALPAGTTQADGNVILALSVPANPSLAPSTGMVRFTVGQAGPVSAFSFDVLSVSSGGSYDGKNAILHLPASGPLLEGYFVVWKVDLSGMPAGETYTVNMEIPSGAWDITGPTGFLLGTPGAQLLTYRITSRILIGIPSTTLTMAITGTKSAHTALKVFTVLPV